MTPCVSGGIIADGRVFQEATTRPETVDRREGALQSTAVLSGQSER